MDFEGVEDDPVEVVGHVKEGVEGGGHIDMGVKRQKKVNLVYSCVLLRSLFNGNSPM